MLMETTAQLTPQSLFDAYRKLPDDAKKAFKDLINHEAESAYRNAEWLPYSADTLKEIWNTPEEDFWDELYAKQHPTP